LRNRLARVFEERLAKGGIAPRLVDNLRADMRADFSFVKFDDTIERGRFDIPLSTNIVSSARTRNSISERLEPSL